MTLQPPKNIAPYVVLLTLPFVLLLHLNSDLQLDIYRTTRHTHLSDDYRLPSSDQLAAASFNYRTAASDLVWIDAILFTARQQSLSRSPRAGTEYADTIIGLDPYFHPVYRWHNTFRYSGAISPTYEDLEATNRILATGIEYFPEDWGLAQSIAINHLGHDIERTPEERIKDLEEAVHYARLGADMDDAPPIVTGLAISLRNRLARVREGLPEFGDQPHGNIDASPEEFQFLLRRYFSADDDRQQELLKQQLIQLGAEDELVALTAEFDDRFRTTYLTNYPYLPPDTFILVDSDLYRWDDSEQSLGFDIIDHGEETHE